MKLKSAINIFLIALYYIIMLLYFYELFWGEINQAIAKGFFYGITSIFTIYFAIQASITNKQTLQFQTAIIFFCSLALMALICSTAMLSVLKIPIFYLILYPGLVIIVSFFALYYESHSNI